MSLNYNVIIKAASMTVNSEDKKRGKTRHTTGHFKFQKVCDCLVSLQACLSVRIAAES